MTSEKVTQLVRAILFRVKTAILIDLEEGWLDRDAVIPSCMISKNNKRRKTRSRDKRSRMSSLSQHIPSLRHCFFHSLIFSWIFRLSWIVPVSSYPSDCNGMSNLCGVKVTDAYFAMVHNAMAAVENGFVIAANHMEDPIVDALDTGYRGLSLDLCNCNGNLQLCHGNDIVGCGIGRVDPLEAFTEINDWVTENPNNVIMISLQINENAGGPISLQMVQELIQLVPGFYEKMYDHWPLGTEWPTLGELIEAGQQILFFYFQGPRGTGQHIAGLNYWYNSVVATNWNWDSVEQIETTLLQQCPMTRGVGESTGDFFHVETYVLETSFFGLQFQPSRSSSQIINTVEFLEPILDACNEIHGYPPTIFSVDFWTEGNLSTLMQQRNALLIGAPTPPAPCPPPPSPAPSAPENPSSAPSVLRPTDSPTSGPSSSRQTTMPPISDDQALDPFSCLFTTNEGNEVVIPDGKSYGEYVSTRCGSWEDFPCYCFEGQMACPYCAITTDDGNLICAHHEETLDFIDGTRNRSCYCEIPENPREDPIISCSAEIINEDDGNVGNEQTISSIEEAERSDSYTIRNLTWASLAVSLALGTTLFI